MIGRADIEGSKSNVAMNAWLPQASYPCGTVTSPAHYAALKLLGLVLTFSSSDLISEGPDYILSPIRTDCHLVVELHPFYRTWLQVIQSLAFLPYPRSLPWCILLCFHVAAVAKGFKGLSRNLTILQIGYLSPKRYSHPLARHFELAIKSYPTKVC